MYRDEGEVSSQDDHITYREEISTPNKITPDTPPLNVSIANENTDKNCREHKIKLKEEVQQRINDQLKEIRVNKRLEFNRLNTKHNEAVNTRKERLEDIAGYYNNSIDDKRSLQNLPTDSKHSNQKRKVAYILRDSIIKYVKGCKLGHNFNPDT